MFNKEINSILDLIKAFPTEESCIVHLEALRWNGNIVSPFDSNSKVYSCKGNKYRCKNTSKYFNVKTNTLFDNTKVPLIKWFMAIWLVTSHKKGISSLQLGRDIDVTQKTAWFMLQRIRNCFGVQDQGLSGEVEADETFHGGKNKNRHADKKVKESQGRSTKDKTPVLGIKQRDGKVITKVTKNTSGSSIRPFVRNNVQQGSILFTDEWKGYNGLSKDYLHLRCDHGKGQYVIGLAHTNGIENFWSLFKRGIIGIYHFASAKHLQKYMDEFSFRYNTRKIGDHLRFNAMLTNMEHRLSYKELING